MMRAFFKFNVFILPTSLFIATLFTYLMYHINSQREAYIVDSDKIDIAHGFILFSLTFGMAYVSLMTILLGSKAIQVAFHRAISARKR